MSESEYLVTECPIPDNFLTYLKIRDVQLQTLMQQMLIMREPASKDCPSDRHLLYDAWKLLSDVDWADMDASWQADMDVWKAKYKGGT